MLFQQQLLQIIIVSKHVDIVGILVNIIIQVPFTRITKLSEHNDA